MSEPPAPPPAPANPGSFSAGAYALLAAGFLLVALQVFGPALSGPFISDDFQIVLENPYFHDLGPDNLVALLDPFGHVVIIVMNYQPVTNLLHSITWQAFGSSTTGHHLVNLTLHVVACLLLVALFVRSGVPRLGASLGGLLFLVHPANVEAVAWITQLKSDAALVLSLLALLTFFRRPNVSTACFVLALLAKPTAAFALPVAMLFQWTGEGRVSWKRFSGWALALVAFSAAELVAFYLSSSGEGRAYESPLELVQTVMSFALRYLVMAATSHGTSTFHEPAPVRSLLDPWWLGALPVLALLGWRLVTTLRQRKEEGVYWAWAAISFAPVCQVVPFLYPIADRYLYFILPGLIGGALLWAGEVGRRLASADESGGRGALSPKALSAAALAGLGLLIVFFGIRGYERARVWRIPSLTLSDAARHYPGGASAHLLEALSAGQRGDAEAVAAALPAVADHSFVRFVALVTSPVFAPMLGAPPVQEAIYEISGDWLESQRGREVTTRPKLKIRANAHLLRNEHVEAEAYLERALRGSRADERVDR